MRCTYDGAGDLRRLMPDFTDEEAARTDFGSYPAAAFYDDMFRLTRYRTDGALCERLVAESFPTLLWLAEKGVRFVPIFGRQRSEEHTSELQSLMRISYAVFCLK